MAKDGAKADGKMKRKLYDQELHKLQIELCRLQGPGLKTLCANGN
jgi:hypothetical protein